MQITNASLQKARRSLLKCEHLGPIVKQHGKCTLTPDQYDPFDALITSIISQQLSVKAAATIEGRVRQLVGKKFRPTPILKANFDDLRAAGLSGRKTEYVQGIADAVKRRQLSFKKLESASNEEVIEKLVELRGVGKWTAEMFMIFALGRIDIFLRLMSVYSEECKYYLGRRRMISMPWKNWQNVGRLIGVLLVGIYGRLRIRKVTVSS